MTGPRKHIEGGGPRPVLICQGCRFAWEPDAREWSAEHIQALAAGCPECGDWLYLGEIAPADSTPIPRSALA